MFSLRIVNVDHYMSLPKSGLDISYSQFRGSQIKNVPVFRIFGSTPSGNKTCLHVHGVFPYILVPYSGEDEAGRLMYQLASSLDKAINVSQNSSNSTRQHVFKIIQVSGRPFYGYHSQDHQFLKIFFYNPLVIKRACDLLQNGAVCGTKFQIHEGHVPFTLQFFIDYNLYGMSFINLKSVVFRKDACPPGVTPGSLPKESFCELEADAVAVDILNRLTIEGELAVNPGLAAIWQEEKERLKRDALDVSQRPQPPLAMSEVLLMEKLMDNLKFQGKCKTPLKENIPYPVETQQTTGSGILDASVLDTHSVSSLASTKPYTEEETTCIDEELVLSLTQSSMLSSSLDQSLFMALDELAAQNEANAVMSQQVEDDSILGSQMLPEDMFGNDISDGELEALHYSLPSELTSGNNCPEDKIDEESNDNFEGNIPQLDGVGDVGGKKKKSKESKRKRRILVENSANETYPLSDGEEILLNTIKDNNCWPESGKQETLEEIFSDEEPYNSPINNFEERCEPLDLEPINVDLISSFETVLRGDPSFTSGDLASEDVMFQPAEDDGGNKTGLSDEPVFKSTLNTSVTKPVVDKNCNIDAVPSLNMFSDTTDMDKSVMLDIGDGEELLDTSQLDEILNEDLNKGLEILCEKSPQQELQENWIRSGGSSEPSEVLVGNGECLNEELLGTAAEIMIIGNLEISEERVLLEEVDLKPDMKNIYLDENELQTNPIPSPIEDKATQIMNENPLLESKDHLQESSSKKDNSNTPLKNLKSPSPKKGAGNKLYIRWFSKKKKRNDFSKKENLFKMSKKEIETYYCQLEKLTKYLSQRTNDEEPQPILWFPIRENATEENLGKKIRKKNKSKPMSAEKAIKIMKKCKFSDDEILKMRSCKVKVHKLSSREIRNLSGKSCKNRKKCKIQSSTSNGNQNSQCKQHYKTNNLKSTPSKTTNDHFDTHILHVRNLGQSTKENRIKSSEYSVINPKSFKNTSPNCEKNTAFQLQEKSGKHKKIKKSQSPKKPSLALDKVPVVQIPNMESTSVLNTVLGFGNIQNNTNKSPKKKKSSKSIKVDEIQQNKSKSKVSKLDITGSESILKGKDEDVKSKEIEINRFNTPSFLDIEEVCKKDQSTSFQLNKECVIKLSPISPSGNKAYETLPEACVGGNNEIYETVFPDNMSSLDSRSNEELIPLKLNAENNRNPLVKVEKLTSSGFGDSITIPEKKVKCDTGPKKQGTLNKKELKLQNIKLLDNTNDRKRPLRIYSLDGTADNSSSDENVEGKESSNKPPDTEAHYTTPNKRRKSKSCRSPRNYVPLSIEIKRSPKSKPKDKTKDEVKPDKGGGGFSAEFKKEVAATKKLEDSSSLETLDSSKCKLKSKLMDPLVFIERLPVVTDFHSNSSNPVKSSQPQDLSSLEKSDSSKCHVKSKLLEPLVSVEKLPSKMDSHSSLKCAIDKKQFRDLSCVEKDNSKCHEESQLKSPLVSIKRLPSMTDLKSGLSDVVDTSQPKASTSSQPLVKRLKVFVKRLSLDTQGDSLKHDRVTKLKKRMHRSFSLPISCE